VLPSSAYRSRGVLLADMHSFGERLNTSGIWNGRKLKYRMHFPYACACLTLQYCRIVEERRHCAQVWCQLVVASPSEVIFSEITLFYAPSEILAVNLKGSGIGQPVCWLDGRIFGFRFSQGAKNSSFLQTFHTTHPQLPIQWLGGTISGGWERPVYAADPSAPASTTVKSEWSYNSISSHALMMWCVGKHTGNFIPTFTQKKVSFLVVARSNISWLARF
jgi:hypothetical protein